MFSLENYLFIESARYNLFDLDFQIIFKTFLDDNMLLLKYYIHLINLCYLINIL